MLVMIPQLMRWTDNIRILEVMAEAGFLSDELARKITEIYFFYREFTHKQALQGGKTPIALDDNIGQCRDVVRQLWQQMMSVPES